MFCLQLGGDLKLIRWHQRSHTVTAACRRLARTHILFWRTGSPLLEGQPDFLILAARLQVHEIDERPLVAG